MLKLSLVAAICVSLSDPALAGTVFRWVDANGTVSFSDTPPEDISNVQAVEVRVDPATPDPAVAERHQAMAELTDKLEENRLRREEQRAASQQREPAPATVIINRGGTPGFIPYYPYRGIRPRGHPGHEQPRGRDKEPPIQKFPRNVPEPNWHPATRKWAVD